MCALSFWEGARVSFHLNYFSLIPQCAVAVSVDTTERASFRAPQLESPSIPGGLQGSSKSIARPGGISECPSLHLSFASLSFSWCCAGCQQSQGADITTSIHDTPCDSDHPTVACVHCFQTVAWATFKQLLANIADTHLNFII